MSKRAFIFDMDGTIVDNMSFHTASWVTFFQRRGKDIDAEEFFRTTAGRQGKEIIRSHLGEELLDDEVLATALLDRLLYQCEVINLTGKSFRMKNRKTIFEADKN